MTRAHRAVSAACLLFCIFESLLIWNVIRPYLLEVIGS